MSLPNAEVCAQKIHELMKSQKVLRATISYDYLKEICERVRFDKAFIAGLSKASRQFKFVFEDVGDEYLVARTKSRYLADDPMNDMDDEA